MIDRVHLLLGLVVLSGILRCAADFRTTIHQRLMSPKKVASAARRFPLLTPPARSAQKPFLPRPRLSIARASSETAAVRKQPRSEEKPRKPVIPGNPMVIGLSHHTATVDVREQLSIPESEWDNASKAIRALNSIDEAGVLSTCNRFEVYLVTKSADAALESVLEYLEGHSGLSRPTLIDNLFYHHGDKAVNHLLRVSAGFDSLVVGEGQILSQVRACHTHGIAQHGSFGTILTKLFNIAIKSGKRVRSETGITRGAVSVSSAAVELAIMRSEEKLGKPLQDAKVCIVGAGTMSRLAITHLLSHDVTNIHIVNRGRERMEQLAEGFPDAQLHLYQLDQLWEQMMQSDMIIMSTSSDGCIVTKENLAANWESRSESSPVMLVDISVPRNVEQEVNDLEHVVAYNVDDLKQVVALNQAKRKGEMVEAEKILVEEFNGFRAWKGSLRCIPVITALLRRGDELIQDEMTKYDSQLNKLDKKQRQMVDRINKNIVNKLLHGPLSELRSQNPSEKVDVSAKLEMVDAMFSLGLEGLLEPPKKTH